MNHAPKRWLLWLHTFYVSVGALMLGFFAYTRLVHSSGAFITHWGMIPIVAILAGVQIVYGVLIFPWLQKKNVWVAMLVSQALFNFVLIAGLEASYEVNSAYWIAWTITIGLSAMTGAVPVIGEASIQIILFIVTVLGLQPSGKTTSRVEFFWLCMACVSAFVGWWILRRFYEIVPTKRQLDTVNDLLEQEQSRSSLIIESIPDGVAVFDTTGKINLINPAAAVLTEWPAKDALGIDVRLVMKLTNEDGKPSDKTDDLFAAALSRKQQVNETVQLGGRRGKATIVSLVISPIMATPDNVVVGAVAVFRDVTQQRQAEKQRAEFISTASHEMRTPVAAIEGYLSLALNDKVSAIDTKARSYLEKAHESTQHLGKLFQDLLTSSKAEDGRLSSHPVVVEMGEYLDKMTGDLRFAAQKKRLAMEFIIGSGEPVDTSATQSGDAVVRPLYYVWADPDRLGEVVTNLLDNAVKYTDHGKITLGLTGDEALVQLYVRDTGVGIPASDVPHLFQKFYRVDSSATRTIGGTGLGLFISRKIVELYKGRIWVESEPGKGSTFFIDLPRLSTARATELFRAQATETALPNIASPAGSS